MNDLRATLEKRFPLIASLRISHGPSDTEEFASFIGVLLATMEKAPPPFCFVFPRKDVIAPISAVLYALGKFSMDFPMLAEQYAKQGFREGQRVKLNPEGKIFEFGGVWKEHEAWFRLKFLNEKASYAWPATDILRIEPTDRKIPKGNSADCFLARNIAELSPLDQLINVKTFGNASLAKNNVLYLGGRDDFDQFLGRISLISSTFEVPSAIETLVSTGLIDQSGSIRSRDKYQATGEPMIASTSRLDYLAAACSKADVSSKVVIIDGAKRITDLASFDTVAETQNVVIIAEAGEEEKLRQLRDRGCIFWQFSISDLELGGQGRRGGRLLDAVFRSAENEAAIKAEAVECQDSHLESCSTALEECQFLLDESDSDETQLLIGKIYSLLMRCSGLLSTPEAEESKALLEKIDTLTSQAEDRIMWLADKPASALREACRTLKNAILSPDLGKAKGRALNTALTAIQQNKGDAIAFVARTSQRTAVGNWLRSEGLEYPVFLPSNVEGFFDSIICTAWPNKLNFSRLINQQAAPLVYLLAYPYERKWLHGFNRHKKNGLVLPNLDASAKSALLDLTDDSPWPEQSISPTSPTAEAELSEAILDFEDRVTRKGLSLQAGLEEETTLARLVSFSGDAYAFLTETVRTPVVTELVAGTAKTGYKIPRKKLEDIRIGDALVFRDGGRRDVIQAIADAHIGPSASLLRERAARWHGALRDSGLNESALVNELIEVNCPRTLQTVRAWLMDDTMIGPQTKADLEAIAYAVGDQTLLGDVPAIWDAIATLRSEHLRAGMQLSRILLEKLPERLGQLREGRARVDIDNTTSAWVVQVENIAERAEPWPRSYVNTILWEDEDF